MSKYLAHTRKLAEATPPTRNRIVDFWRVVAILVVVFGHWLAASIWLQPDDEIALLNSLEWVPYAGWITWIVQVMPIFFLAGGYANARGLGKVERGEERRRDWITARVRRMFTPVIPLLLVWVLLIVVMRTFVPAEVVYAGAMSATVPLWFLAVYLTLTAMAPFTYKWWQRSGPVTIVWLLAAAVAVDVARFVVEVPGIGWANFIFVWAAVHQFGYWWSARDFGNGVPSRTGWTVFGGSLAALVGLTWSGLYPVAMVGIPGAGVTNMTPPTFAMAVLGTMQLGVIWATQPAVRRFTARARAWHGVVAVSGIIMTIYLWHLSAMSLVAAAGLFTFDGRLFRIEPGTATWWLTRPLWLAMLLVVTLLLVAVFARFEWRISRRPAPARVPVVLVGVLLTAGSAAAVAAMGIATKDAVVQWSIPVAAIAGAAMLGALPRLGSGRS
ncbi:MAG: acyltransferase [Acidimicrobiia bacterium]|nr:acyltransferase [Acidimicrobiia bacterium]